MKLGALMMAISLLYCVVKCDRFVVFPAQTRSRVYPILSVARELSKFNHSVTFVLSPSLHMDLMAAGIDIPYIIATNFNKTMSLETTRAVLESAMLGSTFTTTLNSVKEDYRQCHNFMGDSELYQKLKDAKFDYAIVSFAHMLCFEVMAYKLSMPFVYIGAHIDLSLYRVPFFPSFMPTFFSRFSDKMTFPQRISNIFLYVLHLLHPPMPSLENLVSTYAGNRPFISNHQLKQSALIHIVDSDVLMDFTLPVPPNVVLCGGLCTRGGKELPLDIEHFANKLNGLVVVSFGSIVKTIPQIVLDKIIKAFNEIKDISFVVRSGNATRVYENVLLTSWLPQNDLLGHKNTKLFITHCGKSGIFEALYHGVPMIGFPMGRDQFSNAAVIVDKGYGISMDIATFSVDELTKNIKSVIYTQEYKTNIKRASNIFHSRPQTPAQRAAYWMDLVAKYGHQHFRPHAMDMPWYSYYMIDILLLFFTLLVLVRCCRRFIKTHLKVLVKNKLD